MDNPMTAVWELTMGCNMRCKHCGSGCTTALSDELTPEESLNLCDAIGELGLKWVTLSGGEPLLRPDWAAIVQRLREHDVVPNVITNGWLCTEGVIETARRAGVGTFAISIDGPVDVHDYIRKPGAFSRAAQALRLMVSKGVSAGVITTVNRRNLERLDELYDFLRELGVDNWQLQIGLPMGNFKDPSHIGMVLPPEGVETVVDFILDRGRDSDMRIYPADCLGYCSRKDIAARSRAHRSNLPINWLGCNAGRRSLGILHNGDIVGCTSIRDPAFVEGNVRKRSLREIWEDPSAFSWNRKLKKADLGGDCKTCGFGDTCLGGCPNTRLTIHGSVQSGNEYCLYSIGLGKARRALTSVSEATGVRELVQSFIHKGEYQLAGIAIERLLATCQTDPDLLAQYGDVSSALGNLTHALEAHQKALELDPDHLHAKKGLEIVLCAMGAPESRTREAVAQAPVSS